MSFISGTIRAKATIEAASTPNIVNLSAALAGTEYSHAITMNTKQIYIKARNAATLQIAFVSGDTAIKFITIRKGISYSLKDVNLNGVTLYVEADIPATIVEILEWY